MSNARTPERLHELKIEVPKEKAAGLTALRYSLMHLNEYMHLGDGLKTLSKLNQKEGFDCPGCAWPDPDGSRMPMAEYCENGVKAIAEEATKKKIGPAFFQQHSVNDLGQWTDYELGKSGRIIQPMHLPKGSQHYEPISWESAFSLIAKELNDLHSPNEAIFYTSGRTSNEAAFLYQLFVRQYGTNNLPDCSNMCHESTGTALSESLGLGKGSVTLQDLHAADLIICVGQNPGTNHPRMLSALEKCKENGGQIIGINPLPEAGLMNFVNPQRPLKMLSGGTALSDLFLQVKINGDQALFRLFAKQLLQLEKQNPGSVFDHDFIQQFTAGYEDWLTMIEATDEAACLAICGIEREQIEQAVAMLQKANRVIICYAMGLTQHKNSVATIKDLVNLLLCKGSIGKEGSGICPVRGHSNVQGDRTVGIWEKLKPELAENLRKHFNFEPPLEEGFNVINACKAMHEGRAKVFFAMGGNFISAVPDTDYTAKGLTQCKLTVHVSTKLNRSHLVHGEQALILPCLGRTEQDLQAEGEQFVSCENSMGVVQMSKGILSPSSTELKSECAIVAGLAIATLGDKTTVKWQQMISNYDHIRDAIAACVSGFENYNEKVRQPAGFYLPNGPRERQFNTKIGKAIFSCSTLQYAETDEDEFLMMTVRSHDQYNTTIYGLDDRYRGVQNERRVVFMHPKDISSLGLKGGDIVDLESHYDNVVRKADVFRLVPYSIPRGNICTYFPEANSLVPISRQDKKSGIPISKSVKVKVLPSRMFVE